MIANSAFRTLYELGGYWRWKQIMHRAGSSSLPLPAERLLCSGSDVRRMLEDASEQMILQLDV